MTTHRITPQVLEVLALLARYRYLRKSFIDGLLPHRSADSMNRTLKRLRTQGYVSLPREQFRGYNSLYCCYIYQITPKGLEVMKDSQPERATNLLSQGSDASVKNFAHSMMICDALASIEIGAGQSDCAFIPLDAILERAEHNNPLKLALPDQGSASRPGAGRPVRYPLFERQCLVLCAGGRALQSGLADQQPEAGLVPEEVLRL